MQQATDALSLACGALSSKRASFAGTAEQGAVRHGGDGWRGLQHRPPRGREARQLHDGSAAAAARRTGTTLEATQGKILSQSPSDATRIWWHLYGS